MQLKPMGTPPPRDKTTDRIKREIWGKSNNRKDNSHIPREVIIDQFGVEPPVPDFCDGLTCFVCGRSYIPPGRQGEEDMDFAFGPQGVYCRECLQKAVTIDDDAKARLFLGI